MWVGFGDGGLVQYQVLQTPTISEQLRYMTYTTPVSFVYAVGAVDEKVWMDSRPTTGLTTYAQRWQVLDQSNGLQNKQVTGTWLARGRAFLTSNAGELMMLAPDGLTWTNFAGANAHVVFGDSRGVIWVGTDTGLRWLTSAGLAGMSPLEGNAPTGKINAITEDKQGRIWIGHNDGLTLFDRNRFVATFTQTNSPLVSNAVSALQVDSSNALWIGTDAGLNKLDIATWSAYNANNGLPSVNIHDLALTGNGSIAVSTLSGLAILSGTTFVTETMPIAAANLPLTVDELGRLWAGTAVRTKHDQWQGYWTTNSGLKHSMASDVVADGADRVWFAHGDSNKYGVSVRGALLPALDGIQPQIFSVAPNHGSAGTIVTITGSGFGEIVADVQLSIGGSMLDSLSIRDDQIQTVIRPETGSGHVQLVIRGKSLAYGSLTAAESNQAPDTAFDTAGFCATPVISEMTPTGGNVGVDVEIHGTNFDAYWGKVLINGVEHQASGSPTLIRFRIQPNDVSGTLVFENRYPGCAPVDALERASAPQEFRKLNANIGLMRLNQGYAGLGLVIGKPTLAQSFITTDIERRNDDKMEVDSIETVFTSGSTVVRETHANLLPVPSTTGNVPESRKKDIEHSLNAWLWPDLPNPNNDEAEADWQVETILRRNGFVVAQTTKSFTFQRNYKVRVLLVPYLLGSTIDTGTGLPNLCNGYFYSCAELDQLRQNVETHLENLRYRLHPFGEVEFEWSNTVKLAATDEITIKDTTDLYFEGHWMSDKRSEWNDAHNPDVSIVFGMVDSRVAKDSGGFAFQNDMSELANIGLSAIDAICHLGDPITLIITAIMGDTCDVEFPTYVGWATVSVTPGKGEDVSSLIGHEMGHILGLVKPSAGNATHSWDGADYNESHSKYDELRNGQRGDSQAVYSSDLTLYREEGVL